MNENWLQHALRNTQWRIQRQAVALAGLGLFVAVIIGALYLAQSASLATLGRQLETLIAQRNQLEQTNEQLRAEIAELRSVPRLLARAQDLGFVQTSRSDIEYLAVQGYNPNRDETALQLEAAETVPVAVYDESFVGWLQQQWDAFMSQFQNFNQGE